MAGHEGTPEPTVINLIGVILPTEPDAPAENVCWGRRLGCKKPCSENFVPGAEGDAKQYKFCKSCRADLLVPADRARIVPIANQDTYQKGGQKKGGPGLWKSDTERYRLFNYHPKCWHKDDAIVVWHKEAASSEIAQQCQHGRDIPQEWCTQDDDGTWCLKLKWSNKDFQPVYFEPEKGSKKRKVRQAKEGEDEADEDDEDDEDDAGGEEERGEEDEEEHERPRTRTRFAAPEDELHQRLDACVANKLLELHTLMRRVVESASVLEIARNLPPELQCPVSSVRNFNEYAEQHLKQQLDKAASTPAAALMCGDQVKVIKQGDSRFQQTGEVVWVVVEGVKVRFGDASEENFKHESVAKVESAGQFEAPQPDGGVYRSLSSSPSPGGAEPVYRGEASVIGYTAEPSVLTSLALEEGQSATEALLAGLEELFAATLPPSLQPAVSALRTMLLC